LNTATDDLNDDCSNCRHCPQAIYHYELKDGDRSHAEKLIETVAVGWIIAGDTDSSVDGAADAIKLCNI